MCGKSSNHVAELYNRVFYRVQFPYIPDIYLTQKKTQFVDTIIADTVGQPKIQNIMGHQNLLHAVLFGTTWNGLFRVF